VRSKSLKMRYSFTLKRLATAVPLRPLASMFPTRQLSVPNTHFTSPHEDCAHLPVIFHSVFIVCPPMVAVPCPEPCTLSSFWTSIFIVPEAFVSSIVHSKLTSASLALELINVSVQFCLSAKGVFCS